VNFATRLPPGKVLGGKERRDRGIDGGRAFIIPFAEKVSVDFERHGGGGVA
jgi:hypothetical protein